MREQHIWEKPVSHGEILKKIWKNLDMATLDRRHPFHLPVFGTVCDREPRLRTVVLRRFWRRPPQLAFHSHRAAPKVGQILANPNVYWLFYHPEEKFQLRVKGTAAVHSDDDLTEEQWLATEIFARRCYIGEAPTQESDEATSGLPEDLMKRRLTAEESEAGRANFVVITSTIDSIDCMELDAKGHRRALFEWNETGQLATRWLTP